MSISKTYNEDTLLLELKQNNEQVIASLIKEYYSDLYNYAISFGANEMQVKDAIQEVFISLWHRRAEAEKIISLRFYLLKSVKNLTLRSLTKSIKSKELAQNYSYSYFHFEFSSEYKVVEKELENEQKQRISVILNKLPPRNKEVIYLKFFLNISNEQIAEIMSINIQSVYNLMYESLQKFRIAWKLEFANSSV